jgi:nucleoside-diphosphate-sugar epimerase
VTASVTNLKVIVTGATGMVGEGVMLECVENPGVEEVLLVNRRPYGALPPKVKECIVPDFMHLDAAADRLRGCDACFFCAGVSSVGKSEADYTRITWDTTLHFAETLVKLNAGMVFTYVSGMGTDSTEKGRLMWARVKGRTENALTRVGFRAEYNFRPGFMKAMPGQRNLKGSYKALAWLYPVVRAVAPNSVSTLEDVGRAMIRCVTQGYPKQILEVRDINTLGKA